MYVGQVGRYPRNLERRRRYTHASPSVTKTEFRLTPNGCQCSMGKTEADGHEMSDRLPAMTKREQEKRNYQTFREPRTRTIRELNNVYVLANLTSKLLSERQKRIAVGIAD